MINEPTSELLAELRRREQVERYSIEELPAFKDGSFVSRPRWAIYRDGEMRLGPNGPVKDYRAIVYNKQDAEDFLAFLNERADKLRKLHQS